MAKDKMNHRRKVKKERVYVELDISQFDDILKKPGKHKKKTYKGNKKYPPKKHDKNNKYENKQPRANEKPTHPKQKDNKKPTRN